MANPSNNLRELVLTTVILTPGACDNRVRAAIAATTSAGKLRAPAGKLRTWKEQFLCLQVTKRAHFMYLRHKNQDSVFSKNRVAYFEKIYKGTPPLISSFFRKLQVGRKTILTPSHKPCVIFVKFLYDHGVANNLGMADLSCRLLVVEIQPKWNGPSDGWSVFWKYIHSGVEKKVLRMGSAYSGKCSHTLWEYFGAI